METLIVESPIPTMDVKSAFLYGTIDEEVYVMQPPGFQDPKFLAKVYKMEKAMYGLHQAPRAWYGTLLKYLLKNGFQKGLQILPWTRRILEERTELEKMHQVIPKECHLHIVKRIFRYLKGHPKLGLWYPKESPFDLVSFSDSDFGGATQDCKSTTRGCQFLGRRLISWKCKKQTIMDTSITKAEYVAAASCCGQVLWIQNQLLDYGDCFEKKLINVDHIHTDDNVADLLTKPFYAGRFQYLVCKFFPLLGKLSTVSVFLGFGLTFAGTSKFWGVLRILMIGLRLIPLGKHNTDFHPMVDFLEASSLRYALTVKPTVYVSYLRQFWSTARIKTTEEGTKILATVDGIVRTFSESSLRQNLKLQDEEGISSLPDAELFENLTLMGYNISPNQNPSFSGRTVPLFAAMLVHQGKGSGTPTEPHQTPSLEAQTPLHTAHPLSSLPPITTISIPTVTLTETTPISQYTRRTKIAQSSIPLTVADEPASPQRDVSQEEACPTDSDFIADQDKATIDKSSTLPHDSAPGVTSHAAIEGMEINRLKERVKQLEERERVAAINSRDDAPIKGRSMDEGKAATERVSDDTKEIETMLTSMDAATVLASGVVDVPTGSGSIPTASNPAEGSVPTGSEEVPIASPVFATATVMDAQVARELKEQLEKEDQRRAEQIARDAEIARIHAKEELQSMIDGLDSNNETIAKYLEEYHQFSLELPMERNGRS
nr:hypothetical protein [Tanacetum cinerariifolium]